MKTSTAKIIGALFAVIGVVCICYPIITSIWIEIMVGAGLITGAVFALVKIPSEEGLWNKIYYLCISALYAAGGIFMFCNPVGGTAAVMIALGIMFLMEGVLILLYWANTLKKRHALMLLNGIITLILGALILANISTGLWFIGTLVGVDLIFTGIAIFAAPAQNIAARTQDEKDPHEYRPNNLG